MCESNLEKSARGKLHKRIEELEKKLHLMWICIKNNKYNIIIWKKNVELEVKSMNKRIRQIINDLTDWYKLIKFYPLIYETY